MATQGQGPDRRPRSLDPSYAMKLLFWVARMGDSHCLVYKEITWEEARERV
jgi:hypothetical protein